MICDGLSAHIVVLTGPLSVSTQLFAGSLEGRHKLAPLLSPIRHAIRLMKKGRAASCHREGQGRGRAGQGRAGAASTHPRQLGNHHVRHRHRIQPDKNNLPPLGKPSEMFEW
jgi:hypothetical protein